MITPLFPKLEDINLNEYSDESAYEPYTGIVLDPEDKIFKTISGMFRDKKEFYEKLSARGYVVRKVFEKKVFDWIEANAKTTLEAYLMFSTAFSKWKGNNLLNSYYTKLLNDIPQLNREKIKGDPNSIGDMNQKEESTLDETHEKTNIDAINNWPKYNVTLIPLNDDNTIMQNGKPLTMPKVAFNDTIININDFLRSNPEFVHELYSELAIGNNQIKENPFFTGDNYAKKFLVKLEGKGILRYNPEESDKRGGKIDWNPESEPFILTRNAIFDWNRANNYMNLSSINPQTIQLNKIQNAEKQANSLRLSNLGDVDTEKQAQDKEKEIGTANDVIGTLVKNNKKHLIKGNGGTNRVNPEDLSRLKEFDKDRKVLQAGKKDPDAFNNVLNKYQSNSQQEALTKINQAEKEFIDSLKLKIQISNKLDSIDSQIDDVKYKIDQVEKQPDLSVDNALTIKTNLTKKLENLISLRNRVEKEIEHNKNKQPSISSWSNIITPIKGYRAKFVNGDPNKVNESASFKDYIPIVPDMIPCKFVNYNATLGYANQPIDGVITNPGAISNTGTYMSEQDEHWGWVHEQLNQDLFEGNKLRPEVREALLRIANKFKQALGISIEPKDIYFTGSGANFNYNDLSDIDLHLVYDFEEIGINAEILIKYFIAKKQVFNNDYEIRIKGMPVEVGVENLNEPAISSAVYSVVQDKWLLEPKYAAQYLPRPDMKQYYDIVQKIEEVIETRNSHKIGELWDELYKIRKDSLQREGEYGRGNALFKKLRNLGYLERLKNAYYSSASEELSLESLKEII